MPARWDDLKHRTITRYVEPFIGGGAVFFYLNQRFPFEQCTIADVNEELILAYRVIRKIRASPDRRT